MVVESEFVDKYKCNEKDIIIFCCNLFSVMEDDVGGRFDVIWDCGFLFVVVFVFNDNGKWYMKKMCLFFVSDGNYMLESYYYEVDWGMRLLVCIFEEFRNEIYGEDFIIRELEVNRLEEDFNRSLLFVLDLYYYLFKLKES